MNKFKFDFVELKVRKFQTLHFQQRIKRIILIYHAARRCTSLMPQAATNGIEWLHSAFVFIRCAFRCIVHCINSSYSEYWLRRAKGSLLKKASEPLARRSQTSMNKVFQHMMNIRTHRLLAATLSVSFMLIAKAQDPLPVPVMPISNFAPPANPDSVIQG